MKCIRQMQLGKNGLTSEFIMQLKKVFENAEHIKISILKSGTRDKEKARQIAEELIAGLGSNYTYRIIGFTIALQKWRKKR